ncbi:MAG: hypothetical protein NC078_04835, partial [Ruminococcus sp.]|nr:hypothetical protein [Ruminococcus sp.]
MNPSNKFFRKIKLSSVKSVTLPITAISVLTAFLLSACGEPAYPEEAEALPTYTTRHSAEIIYETDTSPETTVATERTTTETTTAQIFGTGDYTSETTETSAPVSEVSLDTSVTTLASAPSLADLPEVGISDYYKGTQTSRTAPAVT